MKLHFTPRSHFSRKVRILLDAWNVDVTLIDAGNVADSSAEAFGPNPLMKVPALVDGERVVLDSDHIARYLALRFDPQDTFGVRTEDVDLLNARAVMNGVMAAEVEILLARRTGIDTSAHRRFDKILASIRQGLGWLEAHAELFLGAPEAGSYAGFHLTCLWDHVALFQIVPLEYPVLRGHVARLSALPHVARSAPR
jgi:glutathione S-transferase